MVQIYDTSLFGTFAHYTQNFTATFSIFSQHDQNIRPTVVN